LIDAGGVYATLHDLQFQDVKPAADLA